MRERKEERDKERETEKERERERERGLHHIYVIMIDITMPKIILFYCIAVYSLAFYYTML